MCQIKLISDCLICIGVKQNVSTLSHFKQSKNSKMYLFCLINISEKWWSWEDLYRNLDVE